ncbi:hypothetical protein DPMN_042383 [Dreissena polymorpha]|uniref:Uncharacterized protein n=1 Tax=Dreissena polymorpha TaxID=45954 RepID=A0A9D4CZG0_DREPO|nr:hypothetical protein DPMN_042383 [Dreissena polymorpha]
MSRLEHITEGADIAAAQVTSRIDDLEREHDILRADLVYIKSQSMRNNIVFTDVPEVDKETPEITESVLRKHIIEALNIAKETADTIKFERAHKEERAKGKRSWIAYEALYVDGRPVRDYGHDGEEIIIISWNVTDLTDCKKSNPSFVNSLSEHDICLMYESWTNRTSDIDLSGYLYSHFF